MKLIRYGEMGQERPAVLLPDGRRIDTSAYVSDYDASFWLSGEQRAFLSSFVASGCPNGVEVDASVRWAAPVAMPSKIVCAGLNYRAHNQEFSQAGATEAAIFLKAPSALCGPYDDTLLPPASQCLDYEVELAVVMGAPARHVSVEDASACIAGYTLLCDYSERSYQLERGGQWTKGKSYDSFAPIGPCLWVPEESVDISSWNLWLSVDGELRQSASCSTMIHSIPELISYASQFMRLCVGDILTTGSPGGVAMGRAGQPYLQAGQVVELGCASLGICRHVIVAE